MGGEVDRTLWAGNLSEKVSEEILYELFLQAGPVDKVKIATERDGRKKSFAFITFSHDASVPYTIQLMDGMLLYGKNLKLQARPGSVHVQPPPQQQQQQYPQPMPQSPYSHQPSSPMDNRYKNNLPSQMPFNPYMINQPMRSQAGPQSTAPHYQRSNTWNGNDQVSQMSSGRDSRDRSRDRDRDRYPKMDRDRSGRRDDYNSGRDSYRGAGSNYRDSDRSDRSEDIESKRQRLLQKQSEVLSRYKQNTHQPSQRSSPQHYSHRRGRY